MSYAICFNLDQSKILLSDNGLTPTDAFVALLYNNLVQHLFHSKNKNNDQRNEHYINPFPNDKF